MIKEALDRTLWRTRYVLRHFFLNSLCQITLPCPVIFGVTPYGWLRAATLTQLLISYGNIIIVLRLLFQKRNRGVKQGLVLLNDSSPSDCYMKYRQYFTFTSEPQGYSNTTFQ